MKVTIFVRILGQINSRELYDTIGHFGMNVTDCKDYSSYTANATWKLQAEFSTTAPFMGK